MSDSANGVIVKDFLEQNWSAWLAYCAEQRISEEDAAEICESLMED